MIKIGYLNKGNLILPEKLSEDYLYILYADGKYETFSFLQSLKAYIESYSNKRKHIKCGIINIGSVKYKEPNVIWLLKIKNGKEEIINNDGWLLEDGSMVSPNFNNYYVPAPTKVRL